MTYDIQLQFGGEERERRDTMIKGVYAVMKGVYAVMKGVFCDEGGVAPKLADPRRAVDSDA